MSVKSVSDPSYWEKTTFLKHQDVIIVGSGIVGLTTAIYLQKKQPNLKIAVVERGTLPTGASTKNAGFACFGSPSELLADLRDQGWDSVIALTEQRCLGLRLLRNLVTDAKLEYAPSGGLEVFTKDQKALFEECEDLLPELNKHLSFLGKIPFSVEKSDLPWGLNNFHQAIYCHYEGSIHPGKMIETLLEICHSLKVTILNGVQVHDIEEDGQQCRVICDHFSLSADLIMLATNAFTTDLMPQLDLYPSRNQVLVTSKIANLKLQGICHYDQGFVYFRNIGKRVLIGGARNHFLQQEQTAEFGLTDNIQSHLINLLHTRIIPETSFTIEHSWSGILGLGSVKTPIVQWQSDRIFAACRMGGMGISIGALIGKMAAEAIASR